jgi:hypothetical protein
MALQEYEVLEHENHLPPDIGFMLLPVYSGCSWVPNKQADNAESSIECTQIWIIAIE